jgi:CheY-like chemotaxis protein
MARILVVDDDPDFVAAARIVLERGGHAVVSAANSNEALQCIAEDTPDLVILDVIMSTVLDGLRVSQELERRVDYRDIPILMVTSIAGTGYAELFPTDEYVHADAFLSKPVSPKRLVKEVERLLKKAP